MELKAGLNRVIFTSVGTKIVGNLYVPEDLIAGKKYLALVTGGPLATVKEQAHGKFANKLSQRGFVTLAFDYRNFGESDGDIPFFENPALKSEDIQSAVCFLQTLEFVDEEKIGALGICASSSYIASALMGEKRIKAFATVSAHFSLYEFFVNNPMINDEQRKMMFADSNAAKQIYYETGKTERDDMVFPIFTGKEEDAFSKEVYDYYFRRVESEWPRFSTKLVPFSFEELAKSHALDYAKFIDIPYLGIVGSEAITKPFTEAFIAAKVKGSKTMKVIEGALHVGAYDRDEYVDEAVDSLTAFYRENLR